MDGCQTQKTWQPGGQPQPQPPQQPQQPQQPRQRQQRQQQQQQNKQQQDTTGTTVQIAAFLPFFSIWFKYVQMFFVLFVLFVLFVQVSRDWLLNADGHQQAWDKGRNIVFFFFGGTRCWYMLRLLCLESSTASCVLVPLVWRLHLPLLISPLCLLIPAPGAAESWRGPCWTARTSWEHMPLLSDVSGWSRPQNHAGGTRKII